MEYWIHQALKWKDKCESYLSENILPLERQVWVYKNQKVVDYTYQYLYQKSIYQSQIGKIECLGEMLDVPNEKKKWMVKYQYDGLNYFKIFNQHEVTEVIDYFLKFTPEDVPEEKSPLQKIIMETEEGDKELEDDALVFDILHHHDENIIYDIMTFYFPNKKINISYTGLRAKFIRREKSIPRREWGKKLEELFDY